MIYHLYYGIVSIIYSDHAEIPAKLSKRKRNEIVEHNLELVGLKDKKNQYPLQLSGG